MIKILVADDHEIVRVGIRQLIDQYDDMGISCEASDGGEVIESLRNESYDLLLLDIEMPGITGLDLISRIKSRYPSQRILIFSMHRETNLITRVLKAGAHGYISKDSDPSTLIMAIRAVAEGGQFLDPVLGAQLVFDDSDSKNHAEETLTDREFSILQMLVRGHKVGEIARELSISNKTVSTHKNRLMKKIGVGNSADLVRYAMHNGLV